MDVCRYNEIKQLIKQDYENFISENSIIKFTFSGATSRILNEFAAMIESNEFEKIMIYTQLTLWGLEHGELRDDIRNIITNIITQESLSKFVEESNPSDFEDIKMDIEKVNVLLNNKI